MRPSFSVDRCWLLTSNFFTQAVTAVADVVADAAVGEVAEGLGVMTATTDRETVDGVAEVAGEAGCVS